MGDPTSADTTNAAAVWESRGTFYGLGRAQPTSRTRSAAHLPPPPARAAPNPRGSAPQPNTAPRPQRRPNPDVAPHRPQLHPGPERGGPAPNSLRQRRGAAQAESRGEGEQRGGESARPGAEPHPRSTAAAPTDFGPGPGADSALKAAAGRGLRATPVRGRDVGAAVWGEGNPGGL